MDALKQVHKLEYNRWIGFRNLYKINLHVFSDTANNQIGCTDDVSDEQVNTLLVNKNKKYPINICTEQ